MAAIISLLGLYGGNRKTKLLLLHKLGYTPLKGSLRNICLSTIRRMSGDRTSLSLDVSLAVPTCSSVLKPLGALRPQPGQTGFTNRSNWFWPDSHTESSALALWLSQVTQ
jgi:hypothetical protein